MNEGHACIMFNLLFRYKFEAAHRFTKSCSMSCATPHGHTWYAVAELRSLVPQLAQDDMVVEFSKLKKNWKTLIDETFDHSYLCNVEDALLPSMRQHIPHLRMVPFPGDPTTELIAALLFHKMQMFLQASGLDKVVEVVRVQVDETPTNSVSWTSDKSFLTNGTYRGYSGWWTSSDPKDRSIKKL